mgnify:FL=1|jgi:hypothetical protein
MNNSNIFKTFSFLSTIIFIHAFSATNVEAASCSSTAGYMTSEGEITDAGVTAKCTVTPDIAYFPVYKIGLCTEVPTYENYQTKCNLIFDKSSAVEIAVNSSNKSTKLDIAGASGISLDNGTYEAAIILLGNTISLKHTATFEKKRSGQEKISGSYQTSSGTDGDGTVCVTRETSGNEDDFGTGGLESFLDCYENVVDSENPTAGKFVESGGAYLASERCKIDSGTGAVDATDEMTVTDASGDLVVYCGMKDKDTLETYSSSNVTDATMQLVIQDFQTAVVTTSSTTAINIGFKVTDMLAVEERTASSVQYTNYFIDGMSLNFTAN